MGATLGQYWRHVALPILTPSILGSDDPAVRERVRRPGDGLPADRRRLNLVTLAHRRPDQRRRPPQPGPRLRDGDGHGRDHGHLDRRLHRPPAPLRAVAAMTAGGPRSRRSAPGDRGAGAAADAPAARRPRGRDVVCVGRLPHRRRCTSSCRWSRRSSSRCGPSRSGRRLHELARRPAVLRRASSTRSSSASSRSSLSIALDRPDRVLGPAARCRGCARSSSS